MFCPKCGRSVKEGAKFCVACGAPLPSAPNSASEPAPAPTSEPAATPTPPPAPARVPVSPVPARKKMSGGMIALIVVLAVLAVAAILLLAINLMRQQGQTSSLTPVENGLISAAPQTDAPAPSQGAGSYDISVMDGTYYCAREAGSTLELYSTGDQLSIYKTYYGAVDVSTLIPAPTGPSFTIDYGGRIIEFYYAAAGRSVTVSEAGESSIFTTDGDQDWVIDATVELQDPFHDPNGYILPTDSRYIDESELYPFDEEEVKLIRNEIYARHGYSFTMEKFRDYFNTKNWYYENPAVNVNTFGTDQMNEYERTNLNVIKAYEEKMGW